MSPAAENAIPAAISDHANLSAETRYARRTTRPAANTVSAEYSVVAENTPCPASGCATLDAAKAITPIASTAKPTRIPLGGRGASSATSPEGEFVVGVATSETGGDACGVAAAPPPSTGGATADSPESGDAGNAYGNGRSGMKLRMHCPPSRLAAYMARSACLSSWSTVQADAPVHTVNPMLGRTMIGMPSIRIAPVNASRIRCAAACDSWTEASMTAANSSPPSRAMVPLSPNAAVSRPATLTKSSSPAGWPRASLTDLKLSRSRHSTAMGMPLGCRRATACSRRCRNRARLARPVRLSRNASRATSDNRFWLSTRTTNCRASTAATRMPSAASMGSCIEWPAACAQPAAAARISGK